MKIELTLHEALNIAGIHSLRLKETLAFVEPMMPLTVEKMSSFTQEERMAWDSLVFRFSKLQDLIGQVIVNELLTIMGYDIIELTFIDKLNLMEKMNIFEADRWKKLRDLRNHLSHEYPDRPDLLVDFLEETFKAAPELSGYLQRIIEKIAGMTIERK